MREFELEVVTPNGVFFKGNAENIIMRTPEGNVGILAGHTDYVCALAEGEGRIFAKGEERRVSFSGGMLSVIEGRVRVLVSEIRWID